MANRTQKRNADTSPTKEVVVESFTKDATTEACLFDLIDNSIDSAREAIALSTKPADSPPTLPESYEGFQIDILIGSQEVKVEDNASGISATELESSVLRFGKRAGRPHGIGFYGVGLNRALFKLGRSITIDTDDGSERSVLELDVRNYLADTSGWHRPFEVSDTTGKRGTKISIRDPDPEISRELADGEWQERIKRNIARRYHRFLQKKLTINFQGTTVKPEFVPVRDNSPFPKLHKSYKSDEDVWIHIEAGEHRDHRFPAELQKGELNPAELTREFGWSVLCNDREIIEADRSEKTGWPPTWHNEYNGFVGRVHFVSSKPKLLPWNTSKTDIDVNNPAYRRALDDMRLFAEKWRQFTRAAKTAKRQGKALPIPADRKSVPLLKPKAAKNGVITARTHDRYVLPADIDEARCGGKILALVGEGKAIDLFENRYTALAMLRMLFEVATIHFVKRKGELDSCHQWCVARHEADRRKPLKDQDKKKYQPGLAMLLDYLTVHWQAIMGAATAAYLDPNLQKFKGFKKDMDDAVHHPFREIDPLRVIEIRDAILPILRHLIES